MSQLAIRKSPSMPMLDIAMIGVDTETPSSKCPLSSGRKASPSTPLHRKLKSAVSLCVGILVCTLVLFVLVALDPSKVAEEPWRGGTPRMRVTIPNYRHWSSTLAASTARSTDDSHRPSQELEIHGSERVAALEGMGMLFRPGTRAMPQLVVAHLADSTTSEDLRLFLRGLHRSGMPAHADVVLLFPSRSVAEDITTVINEEERYFQKLLERERESSETSTQHPERALLSVFNRDAYMRTTPLAGAADATGPRMDSIWGRRHNASKTLDLQPVLQPVDVQEPHYGAFVGFDVQELDPNDALSGFLQAPSMGLRRWNCYHMLLGMVRHRFRHVLVTEVTGVVILADALLATVKKKDASQLHLFATSESWSENATTNGTSMEAVYGSGIWNSLDDEEKRKKVISTGVILGGVRPVRSVAAAMATEIVRVALLRKKRECFSDASLLSYMVHKSSALGRKVASHLQVHESGSSAVNLLPSSHDLLSRNVSRFALVQGLHRLSVSANQRKYFLESLRRDICRSQSDREVYADCRTEPETM